jgi:ABC-type nitrate/sulfonate/bicarbonate transport system substrate-binding protein
MMPRLALIALCALLLAGCGERKETSTPTSTTKLRIALAPLNAGEGAMFSANEDQAGIELEYTVTSDPAAAISKVTQGRADLAVSTEPALLEARGKGTRVVSVAALTQGPFTSLIGAKLSIGSLVDFATKPIGTSGLDYEKAMADTIFTKAHVVDVGDDPAGALNSKKVAAVIAPFGGPPPPRDVTVIPVDRLKVPPFSEYVLVANEDAVKENGDVIRSFIGALARGTHNLNEATKQRAIAPLLKGAGVATVQRLMQPPPGKPYGWHDAAEWARFADWMHQHGLPVKGPGAFTNVLLPGQGL